MLHDVDTSKHLRWKFLTKHLFKNEIKFIIRFQFQVTTTWLDFSCVHCIIMEVSIRRDLTVHII